MMHVVNYVMVRSEWEGRMSRNHCISNYFHADGVGKSVCDSDSE